MSFVGPSSLRHGFPRGPWSSGVAAARRAAALPGGRTPSRAPVPLSGRMSPCILSSGASQGKTRPHSFAPSRGTALRSRRPQLPACLVRRQCMCAFPLMSTGRRGAVTSSQSGSEPRAIGNPREVAMSLPSHGRTARGSHVWASALAHVGREAAVVIGDRVGWASPSGLAVVGYARLKPLPYGVGDVPASSIRASAEKGCSGASSTEPQIGTPSQGSIHQERMSPNLDDEHDREDDSEEGQHASTGRFAAAVPGLCILHSPLPGQREVRPATTYRPTRTRPGSSRGTRCLPRHQMCWVNDTDGPAVVLPRTDARGVESVVL